MPKKSPHSGPITQWSVRIRQDLADRVDLTMIDPMSGRVAYGQRTALIERLLAEHLASLYQENTA